MSHKNNISETLSKVEKLSASILKENYAQAGTPEVSMEDRFNDVVEKAKQLNIPCRISLVSYKSKSEFGDHLEISIELGYGYPDSREIDQLYDFAILGGPNGVQLGEDSVSLAASNSLPSFATVIKSVTLFNGGPRYRW